MGDIITRAIFFKPIALAGVLIALSAFGQSYEAQKPDINGQYAGTFLCSSGEMGITLDLKVGGERDQACRSAQGRCNDKRKGTWQLDGIINFYPTLGNPRAPTGAFEFHGYAIPKGTFLTNIKLTPSYWIKKSENFERSGLAGNVIKGQIHGKPTAEGCHSLKLSKIVAVEP